jgi:hypothetical protein
VTKVDQSVGKQMKSKKIGLLAFKADQQSLKLVDPCKGALCDKALLVHRLVKMTLPTALCSLAIALVFGNIGSDTTIPQQFARIFRIKPTISIKEAVRIAQFHLIKLTKHIFEPSNQLVTIVMIACNHFTRGQNVAVRISYGNDVTRLCLLATLIGDCFAPFFAALWLPSRLRIDRFNS